MKIFTLLLSCFCFLLFISMVVPAAIELPKGFSKIDSFIEDSIKPSVSFVKEFKSKNNRLPTHREFYLWESATYQDSTINFDAEYDMVIESQIIQYITHKSQLREDQKSDFKTDEWEDGFFAIAVWDGQMDRYYFSDTDEYKPPAFPLYIAVFPILFLAGIGILPMFFWWRKYGRKAIVKRPVA